MELLSDDVLVWVARATDRCDETGLAVWSSLDKAQKWVAWRLEADMTWDEPQGDNLHEPIVGYAAGAEVAEIRCAEIKDPVSLVSRYPDKLPSTRFIPDR
jgi:hypothetical protein